MREPVDCFYAALFQTHLVITDIVHRRLRHLARICEAINAHVFLFQSVFDRHCTSPAIPRARNKHVPLKKLSFQALTLCLRLPMVDPIPHPIAVILGNQPLIIERIIKIVEPELINDVLLLPFCPVLLVYRH